MKDDTKMIDSGRDPLRYDGVVNLPVHRASTIIYPSLEAFGRRAEKRYDGVTYGASGTPTTLALAESVSRLEGGFGAVAVSTGLGAVTMALLAFVEKGDHILVTDSVYGPTRSFCDRILTRFGVETTYYDPLVAGGISHLIRPNTRLVFTESPGSLTFEVQNIPAIASAARERGVAVLMDNTWGTPLFFKPFEHGVDISIQAGTKYISGHSDLVIGIITARDEELYRRLKDTVLAFGDVAGPEDCYLALRGLRTMGVRLRHQQQAGIRVAEWFAGRPEVKSVLHPALPSDPGHALWKRDFSGASSVFGVVLETDSEKAVGRMVDGYRFFKIGASWGGFESLVIPAYPADIRTAVLWKEEGFVLRFHIGLEDADDLIADLEEGFSRLNEALDA